MCMYNKLKKKKKNNNNNIPLIYTQICSKINKNLNLYWIF